MGTEQVEGRCGGSWPEFFYECFYLLRKWEQGPPAECGWGGSLRSDWERKGLDQAREDDSRAALRAHLWLLV